MDALVRLRPPPVDPAPVGDWARTERALGTALPADCKRLVETYGDGIFDETIWLLVPVPPTTTATCRRRLRNGTRS